MSDALEQVVAFRMAKGVVDVFEAVQIDEHQCEAAPAALAAVGGLIQLLHEELAVGQIRERIVVRQVFQLRGLAVNLGAQPLRHQQQLEQQKRADTAGHYAGAQCQMAARRRGRIEKADVQVPGFTGQ